jgi:hypothetical protein
MNVDKKYCMSSFLMFRCIADSNKTFKEGIKPNLFIPDFERYPVKTYSDIGDIIRSVLKENVDGKTALMLSSGIDSAILAKYLPKGTKAYTLRCVADGALDETEKAKRYADECKLDHKIINVTWEDYLKYSPLLMGHKGAPIHSIEPQIYKATQQAKDDGIEKLIFGESADCVFGGQSGLFSKNWPLEEFIDRYTYVNPEEVLKDYEIITEPYTNYIKDGLVNICDFMGDFYYRESVGSYKNPCNLAGVRFIAPYTKMYLDIPLDLSRINKGDSKYLVRELYNELYPEIKSSPKIPMPRAVDQWLKEWEGPKREEFKVKSVEGLSGDQKWLIFILEMYLNMINL